MAMFKWNEVIIETDMILKPPKKCEVPDYVKKFLPEIKMGDWYWAIRTKDDTDDETIVVICFLHKKDAAVFKKKIKEL